MAENKLIGPYRVQEELAHSSICSVYRAYEETLSRPVLIKKLHPQMAREEDIRNRFEREAHVCAQVKHDNIVAIYGYHTEPEETMLVLEFVEGLSLGQLITLHTSIPWQPALVILSGVLKGLAFAHGKNVIHRDIKPDNILISIDGQVKISDFGLASIEDAPKLTRQGMVVGTPAYMPPEQVSGSTIDNRSDLFSLGATFYEALTGTCPFYGENFSEIMKKVLNAHPHKPSVVISDIPPELDQIILRLLEKHPSRRYATADHALQDVRSLATQRNVNLEPETVKEYLTIPDDASATGVRSSSTIPTPGPLRRWYSWRPLAYIGAAAIIGALLIPGINRELLRPPTRPASRIRIPAIETQETAPKSAVINGQTKSGKDLPITASQSANKGSVPQVAEIVQPYKVTEKSAKEGLTIKPESDVAQAGEQRLEDLTVPGKLYVSTNPWSTVTVDNTTIGQTPLTAAIELSAGEHQIVFDNDQFPNPVSETVHIKPGDEQRLDIDLWSYFAVIRILSVKPWAEIIIDDVSYGETPRARPIILPFGKHDIQLRNPDYETWHKTIDLKRGDSQLELSVDLVPIGHGKSE